MKAKNRGKTNVPSQERKGQEKQASEKVAVANNGIRFIDFAYGLFRAWHTSLFAEAERTDTTVYETKLGRLKMVGRHGQRQSFRPFCLSPDKVGWREWLRIDIHVPPTCVFSLKCSTHFYFFLNVSI